ncbi:hypothetical protein MBLNU230_g1014t1 [Neophaeotheca triangularis]
MSSTESLERYADSVEEEYLTNRIDELERCIQADQTDVQPIKALFNRAQRHPSSFDRRQILDWESEIRRHQKRTRRFFETLWREEDKLDKLQARQRRESQRPLKRQMSQPRTASQRGSRQGSRPSIRASRSRIEADSESVASMSTQSHSNDEEEPRLYTLPPNHPSTRRAAPRCARPSVSEASTRRGSQHTDHNPSTQAFEQVLNAMRQQQHPLEPDNIQDRNISPLTAAPILNYTGWEPHASYHSERLTNPTNIGAFTFGSSSRSHSHVYNHPFYGPGSYYQQTYADSEVPGHYTPPHQPPPYNALLAEEAKRIFAIYDNSWNSLPHNDPNIPYPARALEAASLDDFSSLWAPDLPRVDNWSRDDIAKANVTTFFLGVVDMTPAYPEIAGRMAMGFDKSTAFYRQVKQLVDILKKEKIRWHSDRLGRRNGGLTGANETLPNEFHARTVFHSVCELMQIAQNWLEENATVSSDAV